jgi:HAD superfamily hydrolase (TIGR01549 family)
MGNAIHGVLSKHGCDLSREQVTEITVKAYHDNFGLGKVKPTCENLDAMLKSLKDMGIILAVVTTDDSYFTEKCLAELGIREYFDILLCDDGKYPHKPDPYAIELIKKKYGVSSNEILMVGDTVTDMMFAKAGGVDAIGVGKTAEARKILGEYTDRTFPDVSYVTGAIK